jgi:hypothetical protein
VLGPDRTSDLYQDARDLVEKWFKRKDRFEDLSAVKILSLESKNNFLLKTSAGEIPVNYIMDRLDRVSDGVYRVVDYKSNRVPLSESQLRRKLQARLYSLMVQIKFKDAKEIRVQFDFLRHGPVEVVFTRDDNVVMYRELQRRAEDILNTPDNKARETLNPECGWCVRKSSCKTLISHVAGGGILGKTPEELADLHAQIQAAEKARKILLDEIETALLTYCIENDMLEFETDNGALISVQAKTRREVDNEAAGIILSSLGLATQFQKFSVTDIDRILRQGLVTGPHADLLKAAIHKKMSDPSIKVDHSGY